MKYQKSERVLFRVHSELTEKWVQDLIAEDPSILGLGDLVLRDKERLQPKAGRLDLLLQDSETKRRYEVEIQLGATDEAHIIRTIEYWDIERKRYPQYDHCAVLIAEDITSRFLNVVSLFNGTIPLIAIQMQAIKVGETITLVFTTVMNQLTRGVVDEDEDAKSAPTDRAYWEKKGTKQTVEMADKVFAIAKSFDDTLELKYNKFYIGLARNGQPDNFMTLRPQKNYMTLGLRLLQSNEITKKIEEAGLDAPEYNVRNGRYRVRLNAGDVHKQASVLKELISLAFD